MGSIYIEKLRELVEGISQTLFQWRRKGATVALGLLATWVTYHVIFGANGTLIYSHKLAEHRELDKQILELKQENARLAQHVDALKTDPAAIEKEAREQLRYARPGEVIYTLPPARQTPSTVTAQTH